MDDRFRLTLAQLNPTVGALAANADKAFDAWQQGKAAGANMVALSEMFITGYNAQDLVLKPAFTRAAMAAIEDLAQRTADGPALAIGGPYLDGDELFNAYWILRNGKVTSRVLKHNLPNETVFDEVRVFNQGPPRGPWLKTRTSSKTVSLGRLCFRTRLVVLPPRRIQ